MSNHRYYETPKSWFAFREEQMKTFYRRNPVPKRDPDTDYNAYTAVLEKWMDDLPDEEKNFENYDIYPTFENNYPVPSSAVNLAAGLAMLLGSWTRDPAHRPSSAPRGSSVS